MFKRRGSKSVNKQSSVWNQALKVLFSTERENTYAAIEHRRGIGSLSIVEIGGILFLQGKKLAQANKTPPSVLQQQKHFLLKNRQQSLFCGPIVNPKNALGKAICESLHYEMCGVSASATAARASRYFHLHPSPGPLFQILAKKCFKCRRLRMRKGINIISQLRHLGQDTMIEGVSLQIDVAGPWTVLCRSKQAVDRETRGSNRLKMKV